MARLEVAEAAVEDLEQMIFTHSLPSDTKARVRRCTEALKQFPLLGAALTGRWEGSRFLLGRWRWMVIVYAFLEEEDRVVIVTIQDGRSAASPSASR